MQIAYYQLHWEGRNYFNLNYLRLFNGTIIVLKMVSDDCNFIL